MGILAFVGIIYIIYRLVDEARGNVSHPGQMNIRRIQDDTTAVATGKLSKREAKKRLYSGYYLDE